MFVRKRIDLQLSRYLWSIFLLMLLQKNTVSYFLFLPAATKLWPRVIFLHLSVILFTGGVCLSACWDTPQPGRHPPRDQADPPDQADTPPGIRQTSPAGSRLQHTVYERPVRILLECILVTNINADACFVSPLAIDSSRQIDTRKSFKM